MPLQHLWAGHKKESGKGAASGTLGTGQTILAFFGDGLKGKLAWRGLGRYGMYDLQTDILWC